MTEATIESNIRSRYNKYMREHLNIVGGVFASGNYIVLIDNDNFDITIKEKFLLNDFSREESKCLRDLFEEGRFMMSGNLLKEYQKVLKRLIDAEWNTKEMVFHLLAIEDKETLDKLAEMSDEELKEALK